MLSFKLKMKSLIFFILFLSIEILCATAHYETAYVEDLCNSNVPIWNLGSENSNSSGILKSSRHQHFLKGMNCTIIIQPPLGFGVVLSVRYIDFRPYVPHCQSYVQVFENDKPSKLCGYSADTSEYQSYSSDGRALALQFFTVNNSGPQYHSEITFTVTSFLKLHYNCDRKMFQCGNLRCIWKGLKCDGHNNCGDQSDESPHRASCGMLSPGGITAIVVGSVMGLLLLILLPFLCCRFCRSKYREEQSASGEPPLIQPTPSYGSSMERNFQHEPDLTPPEPSTSYIRYQDPPPAYKP